jgi:hypothetical protein
MGKGHVLEHGRGIHVIAWLSFALAVFITAIFVAGYPESMSQLGPFVAILVISIVSWGYLLVEATGSRVYINSEGLAAVSFWRPRKLLIPWSEVSSVTFSHCLGWFTVKGRTGHVIRVSIYMTGVILFISMVRENLLPETYRDAEHGFKTAERS